MIAFPLSVGTTVAIAGLSTPASFFSTNMAVAMAAPELPALTAASASPLLTRSKATLTEESFFFLTAVDGDSCIATTSVAFCTVIGR